MTDRCHSEERSDEESYRIRSFASLRMTRIMLRMTRITRRMTRITRRMTCGGEDPSGCALRMTKKKNKYDGRSEWTRKKFGKYSESRRRQMKR